MESDEASPSPLSVQPSTIVHKRTLSLRTEDTEHDISSEAVSSEDDDDDHDVYDWEREKYRKIQFFDDGTMSYFWFVQ